MSAIMVSVQLTSMVCGRCSGTYAIAEDFRSLCHEDGKRRWHCPYCQADWGYNESDNDRLKKKLAEQENRERQKLAAAAAAHDQTKAELRETESKRRAEKAAKTRLKNKIQAGACPCCQERFTNLQKHMEEQHPGFIADESETEVSIEKAEAKT